MDSAGAAGEDRGCGTMQRATLLLGTFAALAGLSTAFAQPFPAPQSQWDGVFTGAQAQRGEVAYAQHCAVCHGADLRGVPKSPAFPGDARRTPALVGDDFASNWNGIPMTDFLERVRISMPQDNPGVLNRATITAIVAFMLESGGYPAGPAELPARGAALSAITFLKDRP